MITKEDIDAFGYYCSSAESTPTEMVKEYSETSGQKPNVDLYQDLILEEFNEWWDEIYKTSPVDELKELSDLVYVVYGYANAKGWDLQEAVKRVHENNMGRMFQEDGTIKRREDGKVIKRPGYPKVTLDDLV